MARWKDDIYSLQNRAWDGYTVTIQVDIVNCEGGIIEVDENVGNFFENIIFISYEPFKHRYKIFKNEKLKEICNCNPIKKYELSLLEIWYNQLIEKEYTEIDLADVLRMFRQGIFIEIAVRKSIDFLKCNPIIGEMYDGELLEKLCAEKTKQYLDYRDDITIILKDAEEKLVQYDWLIEEEKNACCLIFLSMTKKMNVGDFFRHTLTVMMRATISFL